MWVITKCEQHRMVGKIFLPLDPLLRNDALISIPCKGMGIPASLLKSSHYSIPGYAILQKAYLQAQLNIENEQIRGHITRRNTFCQAHLLKSRHSEVHMGISAHHVLTIGALTIDQIIAILGLVIGSLQALVLPVTIYLLVVQTRAMRVQTTALVEQSKEMTAQTRVFIDTIYSSTFQSLYDAEAHISELIMTYPEASRILMSPTPQAAERGHAAGEMSEAMQVIDPELRERVRWLGTAMLDFFEHIWTQSQKGGMPNDVWEAWEDYMGKMLSETRLRHIWHAERGYYSPGFRRFVDLKVGLAPETPIMPPLPHPITTGVTKPLTDIDRRAGDNQAPKVARVLRAVTEDNSEKGAKS